MIVPKTLVILATVLTTTATRIHNGFGHDGWIQDDQGNNHALDRYATVTINGGWGFFWVSKSVCSRNSVAYSWPSGYGDVYILGDGYLYDAGNSQISEEHVCATY